MSNDTMKVICNTCMNPVKTPYDTRHKRSCEPGDYSEIGVVEPDEEEDEVEKDRYGRTFGETREHSWCSVCERDVFSISLMEHKANCKEGEPSDVAVVEDGTAPTCAYCSQRIEQDEFGEHTRECGVSDTGSDLGVLEDE